ncbi:hypothetical protein [Streptomyces sp. CB03911]|uniref:hypothetical protein n=1 Tax=Streptomyces sp. CB03911 TaxID=1804758 RepID=UPI00093B7F48|nr:hypothetical protein [Streptomyces sp. CB03911]OKI20321.1 hypothetical protein A6A07_36920 [Streptomyces sp. CB03911]
MMMLEAFIDLGADDQGDEEGQPLRAAPAWQQTNGGLGGDNDGTAASTTPTRSSPTTAHCRPRPGRTAYRRGAANPIGSTNAIRSGVLGVSVLLAAGGFGSPTAGRRLPLSAGVVASVGFGLSFRPARLFVRAVGITVAVT